MTSRMLADQYHEFMVRSTKDRARRAAFQRAVLGLVRPGGMILDFGAGSGLDAKHYAENGFRVIAYDPSPDMAAHLTRYCSNRTGGGVDVLTMDERAFVAHSASQARCADAITANFAVLNLVQDQRALFSAFEHWLSSDGFILTSVLSPYYLADARYRWWWQHRVEFMRSGRFSVGQGEGVSHRCALTLIEDNARPHFTLAGVLPSSGRPTPMSAFERALSLRRNLYMLLLFRRS